MEKGYEKQREEILRKAARSLIMNRTNGQQYFPCVYYVGKSVAFTLNAAKRMAYGSMHDIEKMDIRSAWRIMHNEQMPAEELKKVSWNEDQRGATYNGRLYVDNFTVYVKV